MIDTFELRKWQFDDNNTLLNMIVIGYDPDKKV